MTPAEPPSPPRVAILMRAPDQPVLLARALASVLEQRFEDWRLVVVNAGGDPVPLEMLLARHETGFGGRAVALHLPVAARGAGPALAAALRHVRSMGGCGLIAFHDAHGSWDPDFLGRMTALLDESVPGPLPVAAVSGWTEVQERFHNGELLEEARVPVVVDPAMADLDAALGAGRFPAIAALCRAEALGEAGLAALPPGGLDRHLGRMLLERGEIALCAAPLAFRHRLAEAEPQPAGADGVPAAAVARNAALRDLAARDPAWLDLLAIQAERDALRAQHGEALFRRVLENIDRNGLWGHHRHEDLQHRLVRVEAALERVERQLDHLGRTTLPVWRRLAPWLRRRWAARQR